jgi:hypothetical protein
VIMPEGFVLSSIWDFLKDGSNQAVLSWIGGGIAAVAAGIWAIVKLMAKKGDHKPLQPSVSADRGSVANPSHPIRLLRPRRERPRHHPAEPRNEISPSHQSCLRAAMRAAAYLGSGCLRTGRVGEVAWAKFLRSFLQCGRRLWPVAWNTKRRISTIACFGVRC